MTLGEQLKALRKEQKISRKTLGKIVGISDRQIIRYEKDEVSIPVDTLADILDALDYDLVLIAKKKEVLHEKDC